MSRLHSVSAWSGITRANLQSSLKITLSLFICLFLIFLVFFQSSVLHMGHMTVLRLVRSMVFTFVALVLVKLTFPLSFSKSVPPQRKILLTCIFWTILWTLFYTIVFARTPNMLHKDIGNYYIVPSLLFSFSYFSTVFISHLPKILRCLTGFLYSLVIFFLLLSGIFYLAYDLIYGQLFDEYALLSVIATNPEEVQNYLTATFTLPQIAGIFAMLLILLASILVSTYKATSQPVFTLTHKKRTALLFCAITYFFVNYLTTVFPADQVLHLRRLNGPMNAFVQLQNNIEKNTQTIALPDTTLPSRLPGTVIVVIGESANRDHMSAFHDNYTKNTTPWEKSLRTNSDFFFFDKGYANFPNTVMAVTQALTSSNQYNKVQLKDSIDLVDLAKKAGYQTYWLSLQNKSTVSDAGITILANRADTTQWLHGYDESVLASLKDIPVQQNNFIIIHLNGSHFRYDKRVPAEFIAKHNLPTASKEDYYDDSLQYTDDVLQQIYDYAKANMHLQAMVYFSDHGENMQYTHTSSPFYFDMVHIPFWVYLSPAYQAAYPQTAAGLKSHQHTIFTNDLIFDTLAGILQAPPEKIYNPAYDISSPQYNLTWETAKTLRGKKDIAEDQ